VETLAKLNRAFDELRYDEMADAIYHFVWGTFCDWYVELVKGAFDEETKVVAAWAFDQILVMLHPLMPFITEELWNANERPYELIVAKWPEPVAQVDPHAKAEVGDLVAVIEAVRAARAEYDLPWSETLRLQFADKDDAFRTRIFANAKKFQQLTKANLQQAEFGAGGINQPVETSPEPMNVSYAAEGRGIHLDAAGHAFYLLVPETVDLETQRIRLGKALAAAEKERDSLAQRLANPNFTERANPEAVEKARADHESKSAEAERLRAALERLG
jgi:valyl-tRNA synthetase